jgi:Ras-related protein Rab-7A
VGADFMTKKIKIEDSDVLLQLWDTAGQERFHQGTIGQSFYRGSNGCVLVYDIINEASLEQLILWRDEAINRLDIDSYFPIVVVGNLFFSLESHILYFLFIFSCKETKST